MLAMFSEEPGRIACITEYRHKDLIKSVPGARWNRNTGVWTVPLSWTSCLALRSTFGSELEIGPDLSEWANTYRSELLIPAMSLRQALSAPGDPDLLPHQRADVAWMNLVRRGVLANDPGAGKTASTIRTLVELTRRGESVFPALVVCPDSVKIAWCREFARWWPGIVVQVVGGTAPQRRKQLTTKAHVYVVNYETLRSHSRLAPYGSTALRRCVECGGEDPKTSVATCQVHERELNKIPFRTAIADECHRVKDPSTQQSRALKAAARGAEIRYALTGTPIANSVVDLWSILNFIDPVEWPSKTRWMDRMVDMTFNVFGGIVVSGIKPERMSEFEATVYPRMRRVTKEVVLPFLPPVVTERRDVEMSPKQRKAYTEMATNMIALMDNGDLLVATSPLTASLRLLQLASSYGELKVSWENGKRVEKLMLTAPSSKIDAFINDLDDFSGSAVIVFAVSKQLIMLLSAALDRHDVPHRIIVGGQLDVDRQTAIDDFQAGRVKMILVTLAAGGTGITLTAADTAVYLQRSWSMLDMEQASGRYHRIGSEKHKSILRIDYVTSGTLEEAVIATLDGKSAGLEDLVRDRELLARAIRGEV